MAPRRRRHRRARPIWQADADRPDAILGTSCARDLEADAPGSAALRCRTCPGTFRFAHLTVQTNVPAAPGLHVYRAVMPRPSRSMRSLGVAILRRRRRHTVPQRPVPAVSPITQDLAESRVSRRHRGDQHRSGRVPSRHDRAHCARVRRSRPRIRDFIADDRGSRPSPRSTRTAGPARPSSGTRLDGDEIVLNSAVGRRWPSNLLRDPRVGLLGHRRRRRLSLDRPDRPASVDHGPGHRPGRHRRDGPPLPRRRPGQGRAAHPRPLRAAARISFRVRIDGVHEHLED